MHFNWFDIIILTIAIFSLIRGYISGLVMQLASLAGLVFCAFFAGKIAQIIYPYLQSITDAEAYLIKPISYVIAFLAIMIVSVIIGKLIEGILKAIRINFLNRITGALFGTIKWMFLISIILNIVLSIDQHERILDKEVKETSTTYSYIKELAPFFIPFLDFDYLLTE